ncbi:UbiA prenyltransferase family protein [Actinomadura rubteroloni]|uniref:UbiA prenyltransferase family protein n=1 Tax=Actinomadura rubteroloni TaxID=1926885 RepID=A0A2P4UIX4_9ACTN|nr:UbiA family prenyltransferase [Actinomadura rubteroloni]POM25003.1 UbiA prenyltransferase family protein [Actinomadura rubteroloni]
MAPPLRFALALARSCHPVPSLAVTALTTAYAAASGRSRRERCLVAGAVLAGQASVGWCNDALDAARDRASGRGGKPVADGAVPPGAVWTAAGAALAACVPLSLASGRRAGAVHLTGVAAAWAYDLGLKGTALSWLPYATGFAALPTFVALAGPSTRPDWTVITASAVLGCGAHLADALPDLDMDRSNGVHGWPHRLGTSRARALTPVPPIAATALLAATRPTRATFAALATAVALTLTARALSARSPHAPFAAAAAVTALDLALLTRPSQDQAHAGHARPWNRAAGAATRPRARRTAG